MNPRREQPDWFRPKGYLHFDARISSPWAIKSIVENPARVATHAFLPFIKFIKSSRRFNRERNGYEKKERPLAYAGHLDSQIFRHYGNLISESYERKLAEHNLSSAVLAYRRLVPPKCNIHFANDAFRTIEQMGSCIALAYDVSQFFESLDHGLLKLRWKQVLDVGTLPDDHYAVFKAITRYAWVDQKDISQAFGLSKTKWREGRQIRICSPDEFRSMVRSPESGEGMIRVKRDGVGVPQGSSISAVLSNLYMLDFDLRMNGIVRQHGGAYFRYSDDVLIISPLASKNAMEAEINAAIADAKLQLNEKKTARVEFENDGQHLNASCPLQYLGFTFDGQTVRVRAQTIARYVRRMKRAVRREKSIARRKGARGGDARVRRQQLYSRYTHLGKRNFISYTAKAREIFPTNAIRDQVKHHWRNLHAELIVEG